MKSGTTIDVDGGWTEGTEPIVPGSKLRAKNMQIDSGPDAVRRLVHLDWNEVAAIVQLPDEARAG
jgi:hypothetical protein